MLTLALLPVITMFGYPGIFAVIFLESGVPFGFFLPGASLLFTAGILASQGLFNPYILIPLVTLAAILGDNVGYWFGAKIGIKLFLRPDSRFFKHEHLAKAQHFYERHGAKTIVLARFVPIIRTFAPIVAGIAGMKYRVFIMYNMLGALLWATGVTTAGWLLGERFPIVEQYITPIVIGIVVLTIIPAVWETIRSQRSTEAA
jgi:membrane-associated protein